eukprot:CAMPEP_0169456114 /NCGR_PEP_ID=MMETSP1042-20121227/16177_1 /TAXON_ID=464988 /ORGANISM="Hemiselmis andersenii, Strain CCMP1180" /LENGTH=187 /DNA_ID=CAMNT_0009568309 /DNA_START=40 /DNA_END=601 /DNA_ORIENTATION=-
MRGTGPRKDRPPPPNPVNVARCRHTAAPRVEDWRKGGAALLFVVLPHYVVSTTPPAQVQHLGVPVGAHGLTHACPIFCAEAAHRLPEAPLLLGRPPLLLVHANRALFHLLLVLSVRVQGPPRLYSPPLWPLLPPILTSLLRLVPARAYLPPSPAFGIATTRGAPLVLLSPAFPRPLRAAVHMRVDAI